jgi:Mn2+/Fe2+ NRAMP family transporter
VMVTVVCYFIVLACSATIYPKEIGTAADAAHALKWLGKDWAAILFAIGLISASYFGATILPLSTATSVCEAMGWERGVDRRFAEAPQYYLIFTAMIVIGAGVAASLNERSLIAVMVFSQVVNGVLLPVIVFFMLRITNDKSIMGTYTNGRFFNIFAWIGTILVAVLSLVMVGMTLLGMG